MANTRLKVCRRCYDKPFEHNRPIILPPDPVPRHDPRPENYDSEIGIVPAGPDYLVDDETQFLLVDDFGFTLLADPPFLLLDVDVVSPPRSGGVVAALDGVRLIANGIGGSPPPPQSGSVAVLLSNVRLVGSGIGSSAPPPVVATSVTFTAATGPFYVPIVPGTILGFVTVDPPTWVGTVSVTGADASLIGVNSFLQIVALVTLTVSREYDITISASP